MKKISLSLTLTCLLMTSPLLQAQNGAATTPSPSAAQIAAVDVSSDTLDSYAGRYRTPSGAILRVWREGDAFNVQATGQAPQVLVAESESMFHVAGSDERLVFGFDASGAATYLDFHSGARHTRALRE